MNSQQLIGTMLACEIGQMERRGSNIRSQLRAQCIQSDGTIDMNPLSCVTASQRFCEDRPYYGGAEPPGWRMRDPLNQERIVGILLALHG
jgi:hypothetical protein